MNWASPSAFFAMGGYALYVWGSYAVAAACIVWELAALVHRTRAIRRALGARELKEAA